MIAEGRREISERLNVSGGHCDIVAVWLEILSASQMCYPARDPCRTIDELHSVAESLAELIGKQGK